MSIKRNTLYVKWKAVSGITGYELNFSNNNEFRNYGPSILRYNKRFTHDTLKWKSGVWYVRVRPYKKVGKKILYGKWSKVKTVKVK